MTLAGLKIAVRSGGGLAARRPSAGDEGMNSVERTALLRHRDMIVDSVDLTYLKEKLIAYDVLNSEELEEIDYEVLTFFSFPFSLIIYVILIFCLENTTS